MSSAELLERFREEARVAELAHSFPHATDSTSYRQDFTLDAALDYEWFINECQAQMLAGGSCVPQQAETGLFGCPLPADSSTTWEEASSQLIYVAHNMRRSDFGSSPNFGDVTAIFNRAYVKDMVLIAPMDTGLYERNCNQTGQVTAGPGGKANCSAYEPQEAVVGTLDHHDHLILSNLYYFAGDTSVFENAKMEFERSAVAGDYTQVPALNSSEVTRYWESNIVGNPRLVGGVKFLIGNFKNLFGTDAGRQLQHVADHYAWPLFWAHGTVKSGGHRRRKTLSARMLGVSSVGSERVLDPSNQHTNATVPSGAEVAFEELWSQVTLARTGTITDSQLDQFWYILQSQQVRVAPLTAHSCAEIDLCAATDTSSGDCICQNQQVVLA